MVSRHVFSLGIKWLRESAVTELMVSVISLIGILVDMDEYRAGRKSEP